MIGFKFRNNNSSKLKVFMAAKRKRRPQKPMAFQALNYKILGVGVLLIVIGFTIMRLENEVYGFISLYISPVVIMAGYIVVAVSILKRPASALNNESDRAPKKIEPANLLRVYLCADLSGDTRRRFRRSRHVIQGFTLSL